MNKSKGIIGIIIAISIAFIFMMIFTNSNYLITNLEEKTPDYFTIVDYSIDQKVTMNELSVVVIDQVPQNMDEIYLDEGTLGFGYAWFWDDGGLDGHPGPGHLKGYIANIHKGDPLSDRWHVESVKVESLFKEDNLLDFCLSDIESIGSLTINENIVNVKARLGNTPITDTELIQISSFYLIKNSMCHSGFGGKIIHDFF